MTSQTISMRKKVLAIKYKLRRAWPEIPEARLMLSVVESAIEDAFLPVKAATAKKKSLRTWDDKVMAINYLSGEMWHAEICGIDSDWVREVIYAVANYQHDARSKRGAKVRKPVSRHLDQPLA